MTHPFPPARSSWRHYFVMLCASILLAACSGAPATPAPTVSPTALAAPTAAPTASVAPTAAQKVIAVINGTLIDGRGQEPVRDAVVLIQGERILAAGARSSLTIPAGAELIDAQGGAILPGFINAHVHGGFVESNLAAWLQGGVTTVRDEGAHSSLTTRALMEWRDTVNQKPQNARLVSAGWMIGVPDGYGNLFVTSPDDAQAKVLEELDAGVDLIKVSLEDGYAGKSGLPKLSAAELTTIIRTAHDRKVRVSGHITQAEYMKIMVEAGVDDIAHNAYDPVPAETLQLMVKKGIAMTPTFTVYRNYGAPVTTCVQNLANFVKAGGMVALGNDYGGGPGSFELGMPMYEIEQMAAAGMTPLQIITASTQNAAIVIGLDGQIGTLTTGKMADLIVVAGDPLQYLKDLANLRLVIHNGVVVVTN